MATGKTTIGRILAARLNVPFFDTDALLAEQFGTTTGELFQRTGEARFREHEADLVLRLLKTSGPSVLSLGGGTVTIERVRYAALETATVISLTASAESIVSRVSSLAARPNLLSESPLRRVHDLLALRRQAYGECHASVSTEARTPEAVADAILEALSTDSLAVPLGTRSYAIELGKDAAPRLRNVLSELSPSSLVVVTDTNVERARGAWLEPALAASTRRHTVVIAPGEPSKTLTTISRIWDEALSFGIDRNAVVLAFGGGVVGDLAGFAAATLLRGLRCVQIPTTLLAMVDSSVGGKTGFDHGAGKNLVGAFYQPQRVVVDVDHLSTLPPRELAAGFAEVVKIALVLDSALLDALEANVARLMTADREVLLPLIRSAIAAKIRVVRDDEHEAGPRGLLNLGHTVGHALEAHGGYSRLLHGEAVAVGTVCELRVTEQLGLSQPGVAARAEALLKQLGLPTQATRTELEESWMYVLKDKKRARDEVKLPVVNRAGAGEMTEVKLAALHEALLRTA